MKEFFLESFDKKPLFVREFNGVQKPKAVILIVHGMSEHSKRYTAFCEFLNANNIIAYVFDLRAHGKTDEQSVGIVTGDNFSDCVLDVDFMAKYIKDLYKNLNFTILGHSYGSFIVQSYIQKFDNYDKVILSGSSYMKTLTNRFALVLASCTARFKGKKAPAKMIFKLSFKSYAKKFENKCWLSSDPMVTKLYAEDDFCNKKFSAGFYQSFFKNAVRLYNKKNIKNIDGKKSVYIFSGNSDPVGAFGKNVTRLFKFYKKAGLNVTLKLYEDGRHEMLNEVNKDEVYKDFLKAIIE